jgi:preprotein translocase subunit YajC
MILVIKLKIIPMILCVIFLIVLLISTILSIKFQMKQKKKYNECLDLIKEKENGTLNTNSGVTEKDIKKIDDKVNLNELMTNLYNTYLEFIERLNKNNKDFEGILIGFIKEFYINKVKVYKLKKHKEITKDIELVNYSILEFDKKKLKFRINITCFNYKTSKDEIIGGSNLERVEQIFLITYVKFRKKWLINNIEKVFEKKQSM